MDWSQGLEPRNADYIVSGYRAISVWEKWETLATWKVLADASKINSYSLLILLHRAAGGLLQT